MLGVLVTIALVGVLVWAANTYLPMDEKFKKILNIVAVVLTVIWLLSVFGIFAGVSDVPVPQFNR